MLVRTHMPPLLSLANRKITGVATVGVALALALPLLQHSVPGQGAALPSPHSPGPYTLPLRFEPNAGQAPSSALFTAHMEGGTLLFEQSGVTMVLAPGATGEKQSSVGIDFLGASAASVEADHPDGAHSSYFTGSDPSGWHTGLPTYNSVMYKGLYSGISAEYTGVEGTLKGTYAVAAGADPSLLRWRYTGARSLGTDSQGNLQIALSANSGTLRELAPVAWQEIEGHRVEVPASYQVGTDDTVSFKLGSYNSAYPLTIDPAITYSTYMGGASTDAALAVAADSSGNTYVAGQTTSTDFPVQNSMQSTNGGLGDAFVAKFNPDGTLAFSTYLGGNGDDVAYSVRVDAAGNIYAAGRTGSGNFPTHNAYQPTGGGSGDAFLVKLTGDGQTLSYGTYLGGSGADTGWGLAIDGSGGAYVGGSAGSTNFPTRNAFQSASGGGYDAFLARIDTNASGNASLVYSTYLGGSGDDYGGGRGSAATGHGVAADAAGNAYITGDTVSTNFPTRNAFQAAEAGNIDAFVAKVNTNATGDASLLYSTYLGGNQTDGGRAVAVDPAGNVYVTGPKGSANFPSRNGYASCSSATSAPFVAKFNMAAAGDASLVYLTCFNSTTTASAASIAVDSTGSAIIAATTAQGSWPVVSPIMGWAGSNDVVVARLNSAGNGLVYSTYLGGAANDYAHDVAIDGAGNAYVVGETQSTNYPTQSAFQATNHGQSDAFITKINEALTGPTPTATFTPTPRPTSTPSPTPSCSINFSDVHSTDYFYQSVSYLYCHGAISGYADGTFRPYNNTTRGQLSKIVVLAEGWSINTTGGPHFSDVPESNPFYQYIETAYNHSVISGYSDGTFRWGNNVTRGQLSKIVVSAEGWAIDTTGGPHFTDVPPSDPFYAHIETAYNRGIISGYSDGTFRPGNNATRGQISKIVYLALTSP
jgi:hypothetical protein